MSDERWVCPVHGVKRMLISKKTGFIYRWCEICELDPVAKLFERELDSKGKDRETER